MSAILYPGAVERNPGPAPGPAPGPERGPDSRCARSCAESPARHDRPRWDRHGWRRALARSSTGGLARGVGLAILAHAGADGIAWPGIDTLGQAAGLSRRAVFYALADLRAAGWIEPVGRTVRGVIRYRCTMPGAAHDPAPHLARLDTMRGAARRQRAKAAQLDADAPPLLAWLDAPTPPAPPARLDAAPAPPTHVEPPDAPCTPGPRRGAPGPGGPGPSSPARRGQASSPALSGPARRGQASSRPPSSPARRGQASSPAPGQLDAPGPARRGAACTPSPPAPPPPSSPAPAPIRPSSTPQHTSSPRRPRHPWPGHKPSSTPHGPSAARGCAGPTRGAPNVWGVWRLCTGSTWPSSWPSSTRPNAAPMGDKSTQITIIGLLPARLLARLDAAQLRPNTRRGPWLLAPPSPAPPIPPKAPDPDPAPDPDLITLGPGPPIRPPAPPTHVEAPINPGSTPST
jgi:hypothetical protein